MARVSTYLTFKRDTERAFTFYAEVFGTQMGEIARMHKAPAHPDYPLADADKDLVLHVELPILGGHVLMGSDTPDGMCGTLSAGNTMALNLEPDTRDETRRLFAALSANGSVDMPLQEMFWGGYFASFTDQFGVRWLMNCDKPEA